MRLTVIVDNLCCRQNLLAEWGYSALLETPEGALMIDTAEHGHVLLHNMTALKINPADIGDLFLSHGHFDHCGGLGEMLRQVPRLRVWGAPGLATERRFGDDAAKTTPLGGGELLRLPDLRPVRDAVTILPGVIAFDVPQEARDPAYVHHERLWEVDGEGRILPDRFSDDLSLLVYGEHGPSLLLGCAHAGLPNIMRHVRERFGVTSLYAVVGGMHLAPVNPMLLDAWMNGLSAFPVRLWRPNHCTGFKAAARLAARMAGSDVDVDWAGAGTRLTL